MTFKYPLVWACHACGEVRPDAQIGVFSLHSADNSLQVNQNYCLDKEECYRKAKAKAEEIFERSKK